VAGDLDLEFRPLAPHLAGGVEDREAAGKLRRLAGLERHAGSVTDSILYLTIGRGLCPAS
jgi:hypothetical protein